MTGDERRRLQAIERGRVPSPRDPALHALLSEGLVEAGRDGYQVTELGQEALAGQYPVREFGVSKWLYLAVAVVLGVAAWLASSGDWWTALLGFATGGGFAELLDRLVLWRRRRTKRDSDANER